MAASRHLEILTRASPTDLVALATLKTRLGITASTEDDQLNGWIDDMTEDVGRITRRGTLALQQYRETQRLVESTETLILARAPVEKGSITVTVDGNAETDFELQDHEAGLLWLEDGWTTDADIVITYRAGWLVEGQITAWAAETTFPTAAGIAWVRPTDPTDTPLLLEATTAGASGAGSEPTWPTTVGGTVTDGTVAWTARSVEELPKGLRGLAISAVRELRSTQDDHPRLTEWRAEGTAERYAEPSATDGELYSPRLLRALQRYAL